MGGGGEKRIISIHVFDILNTVKLVFASLCHNYINKEAPLVLLFIYIHIYVIYICIHIYILLYSTVKFFL